MRRAAARPEANPMGKSAGPAWKGRTAPGPPGSRRGRAPRGRGQGRSRPPSRMTARSSSARLPSPPKRKEPEQRDADPLENGHLALAHLREARLGALEKARRRLHERVVLGALLVEAREL